MALKRIVKKEEVDVRKEEKWLMREIEFLEDFMSDIQELFNLQEKISEFKKYVEESKARDLQKKLQAIQQLIERDEKKFKKFRRILGRSERRRVRYEKRVLGRIETIEKSLDVPKKKELDELLNQSHVFSARIITELSWRVGKIIELTSQKTPNLSLIKKHLDATIEASKALLVLLERLDKFMNEVEIKLHKKKLIQPILSQVIGLTGYLKEGVIKTAAIKSIVPLKYFFEKGLAKKNNLGKHWYNLSSSEAKHKRKYFQLIEQYQSELSRVLSPENIEQLKNIDFEVPPESNLIFLPGFRGPILAFNIHSIPDFTSRGWISHAIPGENLKMVSKNGILTAPLEMILEKKKYFSKKNLDPRRLTDGISFSFQEYKRYQAYMKNVEPRWGPNGGMFLFPIRDVLAPGLILDFENTIDGWPEIVLRDRSYKKNKANIIVSMLSLINGAYPAWLRKYNDTKIFFKEAKEHINLLQDMEKSLQKIKDVRSWESDKYEMLRSKKIDKRVLFAKDFKIMEWQENFELTRKALGKRFMKKNKEAYEEDKEGEEFKRLDKEYTKKHREIREQHTKDQALFSGTGYFYERLSELYLTKNLLQSLIQFLTEDNFFQFSLLVVDGIMFPDKYLNPPLARFAQGNKPNYFNGTIFQQGIDYLNYQKVYGSALAGICLTLTLMKEKPMLFGGSYSTKDYVNYMKKMSPHQVKRLFTHTHRESMKATEIIIKKVFKKDAPCIIGIKRGVLLINKSNIDIDSIRRLAKRGTPIFCQFNYDHNNHFINEEIDPFVRILNLKNLPGARNFYNQKGYFYLKGNKVIAHIRKSNKEIKIN